ncbi:MAG: SAM-dependent methyltransferase [Bacteroidia bacterium]
MQAKPCLYLFPSSLSDDAGKEWLCAKEFELLETIDIWFAENERTARRFLRSLGYKKEFTEHNLFTLDKDTAPSELETYIKLIQSHSNAAILSEAGCPGIADPGSALIKRAHREHIEVIALPGPSSILLALMASGFSGQQFTFHGYLPIDSVQRKSKLKQLEQDANASGSSQLFIETPYRNEQMLESIFACCNAETLLCIASNLTSDSGFCKTKKISDWKKDLPQLHKIPTVFIFGK